MYISRSCSRQLSIKGKLDNPGCVSVWLTRQTKSKYGNAEPSMAIGAPEVLAHVPAEASGTVIPEGEEAKSCQPLARPSIGFLQHALCPFIFQQWLLWQLLVHPFCESLRSVLDGPPLDTVDVRTGSVVSRK